MNFNSSTMASTSSISSSPQFYEHETPGLNSIKEIVVAVNHYFLQVLSDSELWISLKSRCISKLNIKTLKFFEFSDHSVISNLYWGIESIEAAMETKCGGGGEERASKLRNSEKLLQAPALVDEHGSTAGIQNHYIICCSYFYLSLVRKLQDDEFQAALHFFQALLVSPKLVRTELAAELCEDLFPSRFVAELEVIDGIGKKGKESVTDFLDEANVNDRIREASRRYKHWLMYYQVMLYGGNGMPQWNCSSSRNVSSLDDESLCFWEATNYTSESSNSVEHGHGGQIQKASFQNFIQNSYEHLKK